MIAAAKRRWKHNTGAKFSTDSACRELADYSLASGVFNVKLNWPVAEWESYVSSILSDLRANSRRGLAVNFMLPLEQSSEQPLLYRTPPDRWVDY